MKYFASAILTATAYAQFDPTDCCRTMPIDARCIGCTDVAGPLGISALDVVELIDGVLVGALEAEHVDNLETCIKDINPLVTHITTAVQDFEDGSFHKIAAGIDELGHFISQVATTMEDCEKIVTGDDVTKLKNMGEAFLHPKKLLFDSMKHVLLNGVSIYDDIKAAGKDLDDGKYEEAGEMYGTIAAKVLWGGENMVEPIPEAFMQ